MVAVLKSLLTNFYPRPPRGGRRAPLASLLKPYSIFLSTPSARRATLSQGRQGLFCCDFYPRPPRGGRLFLPALPVTGSSISIHALREEGDGLPSHTFSVSFLFLSTPSARRATSETKRGEQNAHKYFYPRPPRGGRLCVPACNGPLLCISIHALREEGDRSTTPFWASPMKFLSTPSARRATFHALDAHA